MTSTLRTALILAATFLTGCGASRSTAPSPFEDGPRGNASEEPIRIDVQNLNFNDISIWAVRQGQRIRLGRVTGKTDHTFRIPWNLAMPISFEIDVTGGRSCRTAQVGVDRNADVWVVVPSNVGSQPCQIGRRG